MLSLQEETPPPYQSNSQSESEFNIFTLFWDRFCCSLAESLTNALICDTDQFSDDASALYPAVRSASLEMLGFLQDTIQTGVGAVAFDDGTSSSAGGILGGSAALDDAFVGWRSTSSEAIMRQSTLGLTSADSWTRSCSGNAPVTSSDSFVSSSTISLSAIFQTSEWQALEGNSSSKKGLYPLQLAFQEASMRRLCTPLQYMFPENVTVDDAGLAAATLPMLPSKYDVQKFDEIIRQELSLADPREGGGDLSAVKMIAGSIREMIETFCKQAKNVVCNPSDEACLTAEGFRPT